MNKVDFKRASFRDHATILEMMREYFSFDCIPWNRHIPSALKSLLTRRNFGEVILIRVGAENAGYLVLTYGFDLEFGGRQAWVTDLYIRAEFRRLGLGKKAMRFLSLWSRRNGVKAIELQVTHKNKKALLFYKAMGFKAYDRILMSKWMGA